MTYTIFHNPRCKKSRRGLEFLKQKTDDYEIVEYLKKSINVDDLKRLLMKLNIPAEELVRTQEEQYKKELKGKHFTNDEWISILLENPKLMKRPVVEGKYKAVIADPPENLKYLF